MESPLHAMQHLEKTTFRPLLFEALKWCQTKKGVPIKIVRLIKSENGFSAICMERNKNDSFENDDIPMIQYFSSEDKKLATEKGDLSVEILVRPDEKKCFNAVRLLPSAFGGTDDIKPSVSFQPTTDLNPSVHMNCSNGCAYSETYDDTAVSEIPGPHFPFGNTKTSAKINSGSLDLTADSQPLSESEIASAFGGVLLRPSVDTGTQTEKIDPHNYETKANPDKTVAPRNSRTGSDQSLKTHSFCLHYETKVNPDKTVKFRLFLQKCYFNQTNFNTTKNHSQLEISTGNLNTKKHEFYIEIKTKEKIVFGAKEESRDCLQYSNGQIVASKQKEVWIINNKFDYYCQVVLNGLIGPSESKNEWRYIQLGKLIFKMDLHDFYIYGVVAVVKTPGIDYTAQWPWKDKDNLPIEPPDNKLVTYKDLVTGLSHPDLFFDFLGEAIKGQFCSDTFSTSKLDCQLILVMALAEPIRNHSVLRDNEMLYDARDFIKEIKKFLPLFYPMMANDTFKGRKTGFNGETKVYRDRKKKFDEKIK